MVDHITQHTYDNIAHAFAESNRNLSPELIGALEKFIALVGTSARVLDLGCGAGRDAMFLQSRGLNVIGADFSLGMLREAKTIGALNLTQMDMLYTGFAAASFQGVWCNAVLLHLPKSTAPDALKEMRRLIAPRGVLFLSVQEGAREDYEPNPYAQSSLERFFARYSQSEVEALLDRGSFQLLEMLRSEVNPKRWLHFFASAKSSILTSAPFLV